ncbi:unknown [Crocosphaera subtropica ATCC 51142]|uniref:DUF3854 domain-containing protein n=1 Tax=Crocosphaera subtropica (strain ATCC 51142 / BH68) TaxID=43989 RepID=B1X1Z3_CROS5|nr:plasmid replication protein, CyRepA1 family [Crocosphaera subtropica]ACB54154.1 unknown [Crocosphaera subtropica ATCC 51142]
MANIFRPTKKGLSCPICGDTTGDCRILPDDSVLCHEAAYETDLVVDNYKFIRTVDPAPWGYFVQQDECARDARQLERFLRRTKTEKKKKDQRQLKNALGSKDFDKIFKSLRNPTGLDKDHRQDLIQRGLSEKDIERFGFFSLEKDQDTVVGVHWTFPGVYKNKFSLRDRGYSVPAFTKEGLVQGYQIRRDPSQEEKKGAKYVWPKTALSSHVVVNKELELPLTYVDYYGKGGDIVILVEGFLKAIIASKITGYPVIGAAGGAFASSPNQLKALLYDFEEVWICPDGGDAINPRVFGRMVSQFNKIGQIRSNIKVKWWGQVTKTNGDVDEISKETFDNAETLKPQEFIRLCNREQRKHLLKEEQKALRQLSLKPFKTIDERYLPDLETLIPELKGIVALKSPKGTGKSYQINKVIERAKLEGRKILTITPRIALGREQAIKWDVEWIGDLKGNTRTLLWENITDLGLCWDSLWKLSESQWSNTLIIIDEAELAMNHFLLSSTCSERRAQILATLETLIPECLKQDGCLLVADADLTDLSLNYFRTLAPGTDTKLIVNKGSKVPTWDILFWKGGSKDAIVQQIFDRLKSPIHEESGPRQRRLAVACDSQAEAEAIEKAVLADDPTINVVRIDRKTTETDFGKAFMENPNESIKDLRPTLFLFTPSMGAGVSIDVDWFDEMYGLFFGTLVPSQSRQMLGRIRTPIPRYIWCKNRGIINHGVIQNEALVMTSEIKSHLFEFNKTTGLLIDVSKVVAGETAEDAELMKTLLTKLWDEKNGTWDNVHIEYYAKIIARNNWDKKQLADTLIRELKAEGHRLEIVEKGGKTDKGEQVREAKKQLPGLEAEAIMNAKTITFEEAQMLENKLTTTEEERLQITKAYLMQELPGLPLTKEFIQKAITENRRKWLNGHKMWWYCTHPEDTVERDLAIWKSHLHSFTQGVAFLPDIKTLSLQIKVLNNIGIIKLVKHLIDNPQEVISKDSPMLLEILAKARRSKNLKTAYSITVTKKSQAIRTINKFLEKVGMKLKFYKEGPDKVRLYQLDRSLIDDPDRQAVLASLDERKRLREEAKKERENENLRIIFGEVKAEKKTPVYTTPLNKVAQRLINSMVEAANAPKELRGLLRKAIALIKVQHSSINILQFWNTIPQTLKIILKASCKKEMASLKDAIQRTRRTSTNPSYRPI